MGAEQSSDSGSSNEPTSSATGTAAQAQEE